jgi:hypothetical protein
MSLRPKLISEITSYARKEIRDKFEDDPCSLDGVFGISIFEDISTRSPDEDCHRYIFGQVDLEEAYKELFLTHSEVNVRNGKYEVGDKIIYYDSEGKGAIHIGRIAGNGKDVVSKWGFDGHVYQHSLLMVPECFGNNIHVFRPLSASRANT